MLFGASKPVYSAGKAGEVSLRLTVCFFLLQAVLKMRWVLGQIFITIVLQTGCLLEGIQ